MNNIEIELIQEYKRLDLLLKDMLNSEEGVSKYISKMENMASASSVVSDWDWDFKMLKRVRYIRNKIMHDKGDSFCEEDDIDFVIDFYDRLLNQEDPLAELRKYRKKKEKATQQTYVNHYDDYRVNNNHSKIAIILIVLLFLAFIIWIEMFAGKFFPRK